MFLSLLLLVAILVAMRQPHPPAISRWFVAQFYGTLLIELCQHILGWQHPVYTYLYDAYTLVILSASAGVVWEAWKTSPSPQKA